MHGSPSGDILQSRSPPEPSLMEGRAGTRTFPLSFTGPLLTEGPLEGVRTKWCQADMRGLLLLLLSLLTSIWRAEPSLVLGDLAWASPTWRELRPGKGCLQWAVLLGTLGRGTEALSEPSRSRGGCEQADPATLRQILTGEGDTPPTQPPARPKEVVQYSWPSKNHKEHHCEILCCFWNALCPTLMVTGNNGIREACYLPYLTGGILRLKESLG